MFKSPDQIVKIMLGIASLMVLESCAVRDDVPAFSDMPPKPDMPSVKDLEHELKQLS